MRNKEAVQRAHDIIHAVVAHEVNLGIDERLTPHFRITHDVLSWVLEGACQQTFNEILNLTEAICKERGYELVRKA